MWSVVILGASCIATICHIATLAQCWSNERNHQELLWNMLGLLYLDVLSKISVSGNAFLEC